MSLALATFDWTLWLVYVAVTVLFEALAMGKWLQIPFLHALKCSLIANFITAIIGGFFSGIISYAFLGMFGSRLNPNPFGQTLAVFTLFGIGSAAIESFFWNVEVKSSPTPPRKGNSSSTSSNISPTTVLLRCLVVHLVGVPLGLVILLFPSRPYPGLESQVAGQRFFYLQRTFVKRALQNYIGEHEALPPVRSYGELLQLFKPDLESYSQDSGLWAAAYEPNYQRFDTGERRRQPIEWNMEASGKKLAEDPKQTQKTVWLTRTRYPDGYCWGWVLNAGGIRQTTDPAELGYAPSTKPSGGR